MRMTIADKGVFGSTMERPPSWSWRTHRGASWPRRGLAASPDGLGMHKIEQFVSVLM